MSEIQTPTPVKGYKAFYVDHEGNLSCRKMAFVVGETYTHKGSPVPCNSGYHFCKNIADVFGYYEHDLSRTAVCEIEALGEIAHEGDKSCTNKIAIGQRLTWEQVHLLANHGKDNTGFKNTGDSNTGHRNTGHSNTGDSNTGHRNTGHSNTGHRNTGHSNTGHRNTGHSNTGDSNTGHRNTGHSNTGHSNTGHRNTGHRNTGDSNTGSYNHGDRWSGYFNSGIAPVMSFNKPVADMTHEKYERLKGVLVIDSYLKLREWMSPYEMSEADKQAYPGWELREGYLKTWTLQEGWANMWAGLSDDYKLAIMELPNFTVKALKAYCGLDVAADFKKLVKKAA